MSHEAPTTRRHANVAYKLLILIGINDGFSRDGGKREGKQGMQVCR